jgi:hypothetical protein
MLYENLIFWFYRQQFYHAIVKDDVKELYRLITLGQDINMRATLADEAFFIKIWIERCTYSRYKLQAPFLLCNASINEDRRPTGLHLAIVFNSLHCLQTLIDLSANKEALVYMSDVELSSDHLHLIERMSTEDEVVTRPREVDATQLLDTVYERKIHRLTEDMIGKRVADWRRQCMKIHTRLGAVLQWGSQMKESTRKQLETEMISSKNSRKHADLVELEDVDEEEKDGKDILMPRQISSLDVSQDSDRYRSAAPIADEVVETDHSSLGSFGDVNPDRAMLAARPLIAPEKELVHSWRDHSMVQALTGAPRVCIANTIVDAKELTVTTQSWMSDRASRHSQSMLSKSSPTKTKAMGPPQNVAEKVVVMGKKSFWLESRAIAVRDRERSGGEKSSSSSRKAPLGVYSHLQSHLPQPKDVYRTEKEKEEDWLANRKTGSMAHRRQMFLDAVKERKEKKFNEELL